MTLVPSLADLASLFTLVPNDPNAYGGIGSRETPADVCSDMTRIATALEARGFRLRSGGAGGADLAFENGTSKPDQREIYIPWKGFNGSDSPYFPARANETAIEAEIEHIRDSFDPRQPVQPLGRPMTPVEITARAQLIAAAFHPAWDRCSQGAKKLHTRNVHQDLGMDLMTPSRFVICWTKDGGPTGGTGQAIRIAQAHGIRVLNLHNSFVRTGVRRALGL
ncbi:hypothetical protein [Microvirga massiliensis]|uniref:hypothetical protein n=1 Tax=Microvirga massiliensis TaxID=1033741 RepID=UPI0006612879|nr:hypothetical protein [Microvirga massiliensis]